MFDFLKNLTKSEDEKRQEAFSAYLDDSLSPSQRREFEALLAEDEDLHAEMALAQSLRQQMREMPRRSVPRIFTLDANVYDAPKKEPLVQAYPILRAATVMTAFFFVLALGLSVFATQSGGNMASVAQTAMEPAPAFDMPMEEAEIAMEEPIEESLAAEKMVGEILEVENEFAEEEATEAEEMPLGSVPQPSADSALPEADEQERTGEAAEEADDLANAGAVIEESEGEAGGNVPSDALGVATFMPTPQPTATVSGLPRSEATQTAVPRAIEPTVVVPDEIADAVDGETAVSETTADYDVEPPSRSLEISQIVLLGLGILLLLLVVVTLLARRKI